MSKQHISHHNKTQTGGYIHWKQRVIMMLICSSLTSPEAVVTVISDADSGNEVSIINTHDPCCMYMPFCTMTYLVEMIYKTQRFALLTFVYNIRVPFRLATKKIPKLHITSSLWGSSRDGRWIAITSTQVIVYHWWIPCETLDHTGNR